MTTRVEHPVPGSGPTRASPRRALVAAVAVAATLALLSLLGDTPGVPRSVGIAGNLAAPWVLGALAVGLAARRPGLGAASGAASLVLAAAAYYAASFARGYASPALAVLYLATALVAGPIAGASGGTLSSGSPRRPLAALAPAAIVLAEVAWVVADRRAWRWDLAAEPQRLADVAVLVVLVAVALAIPAVAVRDRRRRWLLPATVVLGLAGGVAFEVVERVRVG